MLRLAKIFLIGCICLVAVSAWVFFGSPMNLLENRFEAARTLRRETLESHKSDFIKAIAVLKSNPLVAPYGDKRDAGTYLNARVPWINSASPEAASLGIPVRLLEATKQHQRMLDTPWNEQVIRQIDLQGIDFSWMKKLAEFDHWVVDRYGLEEDMVHFEHHGSLKVPIFTR